MAKPVVSILAKMAVKQHLKAIQMVMVKHVGKVVHLHMALVDQTLQIVTILVYVHLHLVVKLVVVMTKAVVLVKEAARIVKEMHVFHHASQFVKEVVKKLVKVAAKNVKVVV